MKSPTPLQIDLFADVVCPWCFLGHHRLERVLESLGQPARVTHRPFMLAPNTPAEGDDIPARLRRKYGVPPEQLWARLEAEARKSDLELDLSKQRFSYPTARAHAHPPRRGEGHARGAGSCALSRELPGGAQHQRPGRPGRHRRAAWLRRGRGDAPDQ